VIFDGLRVNPVLTWWLHRYDYRRASEFGCAFPHGIGHWRNAVAQWFLENTVDDYLLMIDHDIIPTPEAQLVLDSKLDIVGAEYMGNVGAKAHDQEGYLGCGFLKISRKALEDIGEEWFTNGKGCECGIFCAKAHAKGHHPVKVGRVGHVIDTAMIPVDEGYQPISASAYYLTIKNTSKGVIE